MLRTYLRKTYISISCISLLFIGVYHAFPNILVKFPPGKNEVTVSGRIGAARKVCYFVSGKTGQTLKASVSSRNGFVSIFESGEKEYEYVLDVPGKASVCVDNLGRATTFSLTISMK